MTTLIEAYRDVLIEQRVPAVGPLAVVALASAALAVAAFLTFRWLQPGFVDEL